jgi:hypothetical protein
MSQRNLAVNFPYATPQRYQQARNDHAALALTLAIGGLPLGLGALVLQSNFSLLLNTASSLLTVLVFTSPSIVGAGLGVRGMYLPGSRFNRAAWAAAVGAIGAVLVLILWWMSYLYARQQLLDIFN